MVRQHPKPFLHVPVSFELNNKLNLAVCSTSFKMEKWEIAEQAIDDWIARNEPDAIPMPSHCGIQWKKVFLPNGTVLRTVFGGKNHHCHVEGDELRYEGKPTSPNGFANLVGGIRRNAWKVIWILFPRTQTWHLAADLRPPARSARPARSRGQASRAAPGPARPERTAAARCRADQFEPADDGDHREPWQGAQELPEPSADAGMAHASAEPAEPDQPVDQPVHLQQGDEQAEAQAELVRPPGERIKPDRFGGTRTGIDRRRPNACRRRQPREPVHVQPDRER